RRKLPLGAIRVGLFYWLLLRSATRQHCQGDPQKPKAQTGRGPFPRSFTALLSSSAFLAGPGLERSIAAPISRPSVPARRRLRTAGFAPPNAAALPVPASVFGLMDTFDPSACRHIARHPRCNSVVSAVARTPNGRDRGSCVSAKRVCR